MTWYGLPLPGPATGQTVDFTAGDLPPLPAPDVGATPELDGGKLLEHVVRLCEFSEVSRSAGEKLWGRLAGSAAADHGVDYVAARLGEVGITTERIPIPFTRIFHPVDWSLELLPHPDIAEGSRIELQSAVPMEVAGSTDRAAGGTRSPDGGIGDALSSVDVTAQLVYVGEALPVEIATRDIAGKVAVMTVNAAPSSFYQMTHVRTAALRDAGAVGIIAIYDLPGNLQFVGGTLPADFPGFHIGGRDGAFIQAVIAKAATAGRAAALRARLRIEWEPPRSLTATALLGRVPGSDGDRGIILSAHSDSFFGGADDNATGVAALIGLARHYVANPPRHDLYVFLGPGHHHSTGGMAALASVIPDVATRVALAINLEHIALTHVHPSYMLREDDGYGRLRARLMPTGWDSPGREITVSNESEKLLRAIATSAAESMFSAPTHIARPAIAEPWALAALGIPCVQTVETGLWFHTSGDEPGTIGAENLQRAVVFFQTLLDHVDHI